MPAVTHVRAGPSRSSRIRPALHGFNGLRPPLLVALALVLVSVLVLVLVLVLLLVSPVVHARPRTCQLIVAVRGSWLQLRVSVRVLVLAFVEVVEVINGLVRPYILIMPVTRHCTRVRCVRMGLEV